jgi:hypothetical protein
VRGRLESVRGVIEASVEIARAGFQHIHSHRSPLCVDIPSDFVDSGGTGRLQYIEPRQIANIALSQRIKVLGDPMGTAKSTHYGKTTDDDR